MGVDFPYEYGAQHILVSEHLSEFVLVIIQRDATQSSLFIILQVRSTCFGCQPHPSSGVQKL